MAEEETDKEESEDEEGEAPSGRGRTRLLLGLAAVLLVLAGAGIGFVVFSGHPDPPEEAGEEASEADSEEAEAHPLDVAEREHPRAEPPEHENPPNPGARALPGKMYTLDSFIVNIRDRDRDRYLKLRVELELSNDEASEEIEARLPQVRDLVISLLSSKAFDEIRSMEGKDLLREELLHRINMLLTSGTIRSVYFTEFVVQ